jgi:iron uptake system component EfeO
MKHRAVLAGVVAVLVAGVLASGALGGTRQGSTGKVSITLKEFSIGAKSSKLQAGKTTFSVKNSGAFPHNFTIVAATPGDPKPKSKTLQKGQSDTVTATLKPGAYLAICTVGNGFHFSKGMVKSFTVGTFDPSTGKWK